MEAAVNAEVLIKTAALVVAVDIKRNSTPVALVAVVATTVAKEEVLITTQTKEGETLVDHHADQILDQNQPMDQRITNRVDLAADQGLNRLLLIF